MNKFCPECNQTTSHHLDKNEISIKVRGEPITVEEQLLKCENCHLKTTNPTMPDPVLAANAIYRQPY